MKKLLISFCLALLAIGAAEARQLKLSCLHCL